MNEDKKHRVCPVEKAGILDFAFRKLLQNPNKILRPYIREGMTVLDLGCGPGFFTLEMARLVGRGGRVTAADLQEGMLDKAKKKLATAGLAAGVTFHHCPPDAIGVAPGGRFDFILAFYMLHEVPDKSSFLGEIRSLLKSGGKALLAEPNFHVSKDDFKKSIAIMRQAGLEVVEQPRIRFSRAIVLRNPGDESLETRARM